MKAERLFRVLGLVDPALVEEAAAIPRRRTAWKRWAAMSACLTLVLVLSFGWLATGGLRGYGSSSGSDSGGAGAPADTGGTADPGEGSSGAGEEEISFLSYAGPVMPLTTVEDPAGLTAEREITWGFAQGAYPDGEPRQWGAEVTDAYVLRNPTGEDVTLTALYPFIGSFSELAQIRPAVTVDGEATETLLYAGPYAGGFESTYGAENPDTMNLSSPGSWTGYRDLLESGAYQKQALGKYPVLDTPVTVYEFSDFAAPHEQYRAATQAISFDIDPEETAVFTYGINGMEWDGNFRRYSYFVPDGVRGESEQKLLMVLGKDIGEFTLQGYQDGGCDRGEEIDGVSCTVTRSETTLDAVLDRLCRYYAEEQSARSGQESPLDGIPFALYRGAVAELLTQYGGLSGAPMDRYADGRLDDLLQETVSHERVLYLAFPVTVPAGDSVRLECRLWKEPSYHFGGSGSGNEGLQGYDLVTRLGSTLMFTRQSAALAHWENVELTGQNFGFDPEKGVTHLELNPEREHYYLELRPLEE